MNILYNGLPALEAGIITIPLVLYQGSQVVLGQVVVAIMKAWMRRVKATEEESMVPLPLEVAVEKEGSVEDLEQNPVPMELRPI